ncbi:P27 family phage terminase small subunit [Rhodococcus pyridinivorans]|uniref:Phage-related terminase small subunit n=1 Tax=Rhodococcus pyridinivorans AK37 TaxID=1114960 RepID=H0JND0_9NOCA|nr:P27 family phage terminase small subunit [Rhodococcus pyridinivorans]EHK84902.1 phage-related terminase small subunit [Rhodococcus pyridinivorans AK37]MCD2142277.1 P27 family phage terminase small subunit [Rhodococcus pyridinivorans]
MKVPEGAKILGVTVPRAGTNEDDELLAQRRRGLEAIGAPPEHLGDDDREVWIELRQLVAELPFIKPHHRPLFEAWVGQVAIMRQARAELNAEGLTKPGTRGGTVKHPAANTLEAAARTARAYARDLGLTPSIEADIMRKAVLEPLDPYAGDDDDDDDTPEWAKEYTRPRRR